MNDFETTAIEACKTLRAQLGGMIFAFPIEESNPFSGYAVVMYASEIDKYFVYPSAEDMSLAATGVLTIMELLREKGIEIDYDRDVRLISYQAQMDAPSTIMRRLKKEQVNKPLFIKDVDFIDESDEHEELVSAQGIIKWSYIEMINRKNPKATEVMKGYFQILASHKYGKTAAAIRQEVHRMGKEQAVRWIEKTYKRYIHDDWEIFNLVTEVARK